MRWTVSLLCAAAALCLGLAAAKADDQPDIDIVYPQSANVFDVVRDGGVDNTGKTDVTAKLQALLSARSRSISVLYFPKGTYLVSGELVVKIDRSRNDASHSHGPWIVGEKRSETIIRLKDGTWPKPIYDLMEGKEKRLDKQVVLSTGDSTNTTFNKIIRNLTVNTGKNNAGAIGLQYCVSNSGFLGEVSIISEDGKGVAGLALAGVENGPGQVRNVQTRGFDIGFYNAAMHMMTVSHLTIENPNKIGVVNVGMAAAEDFNITMNAPGAAGTPGSPGVAIDMRGGVLSLVGARLTGVSGLAVTHKGMLYLRDAKAVGYAGVLEAGKLTVDEFTSDKTVSLFDRGDKAIALPIKKTPMVPYEKDMSKWANVLDYGAVGDGKADDTEAIQKALNDTSKTTVLFPYGGKPWGVNERHLVPEKIGRQFRITKPLVLGPTIERVVGVPGHISHKFADKATFTIGDGKPEVVVIEGMKMPPILVKTSRTVVISSTSAAYPWESLGEVRGYEASTGLTLEGTGDVFLNDVSNAFVVNNPRQQVWVRFYNNETGWWLKMPCVNVYAGSVWILGWKSEAFNRRVLIKADGRVELFGFNSYSQSKKAAVPEEDVPIIENQGGQFSVINLAQRGVRKYGKLIQETVDGQTKMLTSKENGSPDLGIYTDIPK